MEHLAGRTLGVPGSRGPGVGRSLVQVAVQAGAHVIGCDIPGCAGDGDEEVFLHADVALESDAKRFIQAAIAKFGRLDFLVNNACRARRDDRDPHDTPAEVILDSIRSNAMPGINCAAAAIPHMIDAGAGVIAHVTSVSAVCGGLGQTAYSCAKSMLERHAKGIAAAYGRFGVRAFCPMLSTVPNDGSGWAERDRLMPNLRKAAAALSPAQRLLTPDDAAHAILWLCSDWLWPLNGQVIPLDGGQLAAGVPLVGGDWRTQLCRIAEFGLLANVEEFAGAADMALIPS